MRKKLLLFSELTAYQPRGGGKISPSEACKEEDWCGRKFYLDLASFEPDASFANAAEMDNQLNRLFDLGTLIHWYVQSNLLRAGRLKAAEVLVEDKSLGVRGSGDGIAYVYVNSNEAEEALLEVKSMNTFQFGSLQAPVETQVKQATIYAKILGLKWILMFYYDKNTSAIKTFVVQPNEAFFLRFADLARTLTQLLARNTKLARSRDAKHHALPARTCPAITCARAKKCPYAKRCFLELAP